MPGAAFLEAAKPSLTAASGLFSYYLVVPPGAPPALRPTLSLWALAP